MHRLTGIDPWYLSRIRNIVTNETALQRKKTFTKSEFLWLKQIGFSDKRIGTLVGKSELAVRRKRKLLGVKPSVFQIDTLSGEVPARTNYLYLTYNGNHNDVSPLGPGGTLILGSGPYHIGSSVEFDWSSVHTALALGRRGRKTIVVNCNPETVSTDYDMSHRLYFEELSFETVADIYEFEKPGGVIVSVGGQASNNLARPLEKQGFRILGTKAKDIDRAEDRKKFSRLLDEIKVAQPPWSAFTTLKDAGQFALRVGYPVLVRPSYVLSGSAMSVCRDRLELREFVGKAAAISKEHPVTISKFILGAKEIEFDAIAESGNLRAFVISEHVENAGVHSGDATVVYPAYEIGPDSENEMIHTARKLARALRITGPYNIQYLLREGKIYVIEVNLRASRTFPFVSKATGVNLPEVFAAALFRKSKSITIPHPNYAVVKSPQFSFARLEGADPVLRVEMASTGEVACFGRDSREALLKSISASTSFGQNGAKAALLCLGGEKHKRKFIESARTLKRLGYSIYATEGTCAYLNALGVAAKRIYKVYEEKRPNVVDLVGGKQVAFVVNLSDPTKGGEKTKKRIRTDGYFLRRATVDSHTPLFTDLNLARFFVKALGEYGREMLEIRPWGSYVREKKIL